MKKIFMVLGFLTLLLSSLSARMIFDGKIIFTSHATNKDSLSYLIVEKAGGVLDTFATIDTSGTVTLHYSFLELFLEGDLWSLAGKRHYFVDATGADTNYIINAATALVITGDNNIQFGKIVTFVDNAYFDNHIYGSVDTKVIDWDGWQWRLDADGDDSLAVFTWHNTDTLWSDTITHIMEWTGVGGYHADVMVCVTSDTITSAATLVLTNHNNFVITGGADIDSIDQSCTFPNWAIAYIEFTGTAGFNGIVDGKNLKLAGNFVYSADDMIMLQRRGNIFYEVSRSPN